MLKHIIILLFLSVLADASIWIPPTQSRVAEPVKFVITYPKFIDPSNNFILNMILFENENYTLPVSFKAKLTSGYEPNKQLLAEQTFTQSQYGLEQHYFTNLKSVSIGEYGFQVAVEFITNTFENYTDNGEYMSQLTDKYVFVQTDKAVYKPTQTINFRAVALTRQLLPMSGLVSVVIEDPKRNQIKVWRNKTLDHGVFGGSFTLSDYVNLGDWTIKYTGDTIPETTKTFTVQQYVLPKYEVNFDFGTKGYWLFNSDESNYVGFVRAKYTFGKSVRGRGVARLKSTGGCNWRYDYPSNRYYGDSNQKTYEQLKFSVVLAGDGSDTDGRFVLNGVNEILNAESSGPIPLDYSGGATAWMTQPQMNREQCNLQLEVNVTEELTGEVIRSEGSVMLYRDPYKIKAHDSVQKTLKPGLPFTMRMQVTNPDDSSVGAGTEVNMQVFIWNVNDTSNRYVSCSPYSRSYNSEPTREANLTLSASTDSNGLATFEITPPKDVGYVIFKASLKNYPIVQVCDRRQPPRSESKQSVSIMIDRPISASASLPKVGDTLTFKVKTTYPAAYIYFLIAQNGQPFFYRKYTTPVSITADSATYSIDVILPQQAAPRCAAAVWTVENTAHEVLADAIEFKVDGLVRQNVSASFSPSTVKPGGQTSLTVKTSEPGALVALLAVDKSVKLLKSGNDISLDDVLGAVGGGNQYGGGSVSPLLWRCWRCGWWPSWIDSSNAESVFRGINMVISSNARTGSHGLDYFYPMLEDGPMFAVADAGGGMEFAAMDMNEAMARRPVAAPAPSAPTSSSSSTRVRKEFPEVWFWRAGVLDDSGTLVQSLTAPDTITTWVLSAFAVGNQDGFGALPSPAELVVFQKFFVKLDVPYATVIRDEQFEIKIVVFNYEASAQKVNIELKKSLLFEISSDAGQTYASETYKAVATPPANDGLSISIWIRPKVLGEITLEVSAISATDAGSGDAMRKVVMVEPEGEVRYANKPIFVRFDKQTTSQYSIDVSKMFGQVSQDLVVSGSKMFQLQAIGDLLGPALSSLGSQIRLPTGCGEQTMVILAPNIYIYKYLKAVNILTPELESKTVRFVEQGYQRELTYKRNDGGFSAFGSSDDYSSTWLTAFVMRTFRAAVKFVDTEIGDAIFEESWNFLKKMAKSDGMFTEAGKVLHHSMKGGATSEVNLAAYIYTAYAEAGGVNAYAWSSLSSTRNRLVGIATDTSKDPYQLALIAYGMSILPSDISVSKTIMNRLMTMVTRDGDLMYWKPAGDQSSVNEYSRSGPSQIETSAYVLLTLCNHNQIENATMVARWLMSQRNSLGGFSSTQDTVVGLHALAEFASRLTANGMNLEIQADFNFADGGVGISKTIRIDGSNSRLLQSFDLPRDRQSLTSVDLSVTGIGVGLVQLALKYNIQSQKVMDSGDYTILISELTSKRKKRQATVSDSQSPNTINMLGCVRPVSSQARTGMVVLEMGIPTGYSGDLDSTLSLNTLSDNANSDNGVVTVSLGPQVAPNPSSVRRTPLKRIELGDRKLVYYFDSLEENSQVCVVGNMMRTSLAKNVQPSVARVYSYYEPSLANATLYSFGGMSASRQLTSQPVITCPPGAICYVERSSAASPRLLHLTSAVAGFIILAAMLIFT